MSDVQKLIAELEAAGHTEAAAFARSLAGRAEEVPEPKPEPKPKPDPNAPKYSLEELRGMSAEQVREDLDEVNRSLVVHSQAAA